MGGWEQAAHIMTVAGSAASIQSGHAQAKTMRGARSEAIQENLRIRKEAEAAAKQKKEGVQGTQTGVNLLKDLLAQNDPVQSGETTKMKLRITGGSQVG